MSFISVINDLKINGIFLADSAVTKIPEQPSEYLVESWRVLSPVTLRPGLSLAGQKYRESSGLPNDLFPDHQDD